MQQKAEYYHFDFDFFFCKYQDLNRIVFLNMLRKCSRKYWKENNISELMKNEKLKLINTVPLPYIHEAMKRGKERI